MIRDAGLPDVPILLVGTKCDLDQEREVTAQEGAQFAAEKLCSFIETSSLQTINVREGFFDLIRNINKWRETHGSSCDYKSKRPNPPDYCIVM